MAIDIDVRSNLDSIVSELGRWPPELEEYAAQALNEGMLASRTKGADDAATARRTLSAYINERMEGSRATPSRLAAVVTFDTRPLNTNKLGLSPEQAMAYYRGTIAANVGGGQARPFVARFSNGSVHNVIRLAKSNVSFPKYVRKRKSTGDPAADKRRALRTPRGGFGKNKTVHRRNRLPIASIKIFIGRETIATFTRALETLGVEVFEERFYRLLQKGWSIPLIRYDFKFLTRRLN